MSDIARTLPIEDYDEDGNWICPECDNEGAPTDARSAARSTAAIKRLISGRRGPSPRPSM